MLGENALLAGGKGKWVWGEAWGFARPTAEGFVTRVRRLAEGRAGGSPVGCSEGSCVSERQEWGEVEMQGQFLQHLGVPSRFIDFGLQVRTV